MPKRNASGAGSIRQRPDGRWEGRYSSGMDPGTGKQLQKSVYAASQGAVLKKLQAIQVARENGTFTEPSRLTVGAWMDIWTADYLGHVKEATRTRYQQHVKNHIKPALGAVGLQKLKPHQVQRFYNTLQEDGRAPKTIKDINGVLHAALQQAIKIGYLPSNPTEACILPRVTKREMQVLDDDAAAAFLKAIQGDVYEAIFFVDLFTGMRQSEILGLTWDVVDFTAGTLTLSKQLLKERATNGQYYMGSLKNDKTRQLTPAPIVMAKLKERQRQQTEAQLKAGPLWSNPWNLVFTNERGGHLAHNTVRNHYKAIVRVLGKPDLRFHDMRHSYAVMALMNGDDVKTVQDALGHHTAAFTLDTYGHTTSQMQKESAARMEQRIKALADEG